MYFQLLDTKVGFIMPIQRQRKEMPIPDVMIQFYNHLLIKLNKKYPDLFPHTQYKKYPITDYLILSLDNLDLISNEIKDLSLIICFGQKAHQIVKKVIEKNQLNIKTIKTKNIAYPRSRSLKQLNGNNKVRFRTSFKVLDIYQDLDQKLISI